MLGIYLGLDLGTQGCRAIAATEHGEILASSSVALVASVDGLPEGWSEQDPRKWWPRIREAVRGVTGEVGGRLDAIAVDSTSGTILAVDERGDPLRNAIMYNDGRALRETAVVSESAAYLEEKLGYRAKPSFATPKLLWIRRHERSIFESANAFIHAADFVTTRLTGGPAITDHTNALKSCFDLLDYSWPSFLDDIGIPTEKLPEVVHPGEEIGEVSERASAETGLEPGTKVLAGLTDGCASQIASGAAGIGEWETTLGTTMVIKGVTRELVKDPLGRIYSHMHPEGTWMPGGASSTGGECLDLRYRGNDLKQLDRKAKACVPTSLLVYPLARKGERFPFVYPEAEGFVVGRSRSSAETYAAHLEGVAYLERMAYETLEELGAGIGGDLYTAGGGSRSSVWLQIRANVIGRRISRPRTPEAAMGGAILAASSDTGVGLGNMARSMVHADLSVEPDDAVKTVYDEGYQRFLSEIAQRFKVPTPG